MNKKNLIFIFLDGVGVGSGDAPFLSCKPMYFPQDLSLHQIVPVQNGGLCKAVDANLNLEGIPQSATGQSSLFTGVNTAKLLGHHLFAFPNKKLRSLLMEQNLLKNFVDSGRKAVFFNAYPIGSKALNNGDVSVSPDGAINAVIKDPKLKRISVTTTMTFSIAQTFFSIHDLKNETCLYQDFTNKQLNENEKYSSYKVPDFSPLKAGRILGLESKKYDMLLYEYFITDRIGHKMDMERSIHIINVIQDFIHSILSTINLNETTLVITSDHGNIEVINKRAHTTNPVPLLVWGKDKEKITHKCNSIVDVTPTLKKIFEIKQK
jgi:hypothetical protein